MLIEVGPDSVEINPQVYVADIVQNTTRGAGLEVWRKFVRRGLTRRQLDGN